MSGLVKISQKIFTKPLRNFFPEGLKIIFYHKYYPIFLVSTTVLFDEIKFALTAIKTFNFAKQNRSADKENMVIFTMKYYL